MYIKDLEKAETLPFRLSIRKSSNYDSWECYHITGRGYYTWLQRFIKKHVGEPFDDVFSLFKKALKKRKVNSEDSQGLIDYFLDEVLYTDRRYHWYYYYVDEDGVIREKEQKKKNRDKVVYIGEPETVYFLNTQYKEAVWSYLVICFGRENAKRMVNEGISNKEFLSETNEVRRFNNLCMRESIKSTWYSYGCLSWFEIWSAYWFYADKVTLKYRSPEYRQYMAESLDKIRKWHREALLEKIDKFNRCEIEHKEHPILIE